jgi:hypothetical protein
MKGNLLTSPCGPLCLLAYRPTLRDDGGHCTWRRRWWGAWRAKLHCPVRASAHLEATISRDLAQASAGDVLSGLKAIEGEG